MSGNRGGYYDDTSPGSEAEAIERGEVTPVTPEPYTREELAQARLRLRSIEDMVGISEWDVMMLRRLFATARVGLSAIKELEDLRPLAARVARITGDIMAFDGDKRGMLAALEDAEDELINAAVAILAIDAARNKETPRSGLRSSPEENSNG